MASVTTLVPLQVYLETSYRPDRDWIDGQLRERNAGEKPHARIWLIDPRRRKAFSADARGTMQPVAEELGVPGTAIRVSVDAMFAELD